MTIWPGGAGRAPGLRRADRSSSFRPSCLLGWGTISRSAILCVSLPRRPFLAKQYDSAPELTIDLDKSYTARIATNHGDISVELDAAQSPQTVNNFVFLARDGYYDDVIFHRVVPGFVVQGGDPTGTGGGGPGYKFRDELEGEGTYSRGTVAMANAGPNTNGSQFFVCLENVGLPHAYTIFGRVVDGMDAVDAIAELPRQGEKPVGDAIMKGVTIEEG